MLKTFIERPVLSTVVSIIILMLGFISISSLPVEQYPDIAPPTITITTVYPGASAETVLESVITPIEEQVNGVEGMTYITSTAANNGTAAITVYFDQDVDADVAAVEVQNRVSRANPLLPQEVKQIGVTTQKQQTSALMFLGFYSENPDYDAVFVQNYLRINVIPAMQRINGIGNVSVYQQNDYAMRIWLKPEKLSAYNLVPSDIAGALNEQNIEAAAGSLGENNGDAFTYVVKYSGRFKYEKQYEDIVIKALGNGEYLRLKDVADIELASQSYTSGAMTKGFASIFMGIFQTKGSNAQDIIRDIKVTLDNLEKDFPKGMTYSIPYDTSLFLTASIDKVITTLLEAFLLVFIVVFIFLQDLRSTLIPAIAVPVSIIGTFFFLNILGYSINLLTLFALVLAIGIVVDDAIVVVEAVHAKLDHGEKSGKSATLTAMNEIAGAIVSITLVMAAVFVPVTFVEGPTGVFYKQFGVTLIIAILISAVNALTLSPALCALFLKPHDEEKLKNKNIFQRFHTLFNRGFNATVNKYGKALQFLFKRRWIPALLVILAGIGIYWASTTTRTGFVPNEDRGVIFANIELPSGASLDRTKAVIDEMNAKTQNLPGIEEVSFVSGRSLVSGAGSNFAMAFIKLKDWKERKDPSLSTDATIGKMFGIASTIQEANIIFFAPPSVQGFGFAGGFEVNLLDRFGGNFTELDKVNKEFIGALMKHPEIQYAQSSFNTDYPQYEMEVNVPLAKEKGVQINSIFSTLQGYIGGIYASDFARFGKQFRVYIQSLPEDRSNVDDLDNMYVRTNTGEMTPITQFVTLKRVYGPQSVTRFNLFNSTKLSGGVNPGYSTGDAIKVIEEEAAKLPSNYSVAYSGLTREEVNAGSQTTFILILSLLFVYFLLSAQYESYLLPFAVVLSMPLGVFGAYFSTKIVQRRRQGESLINSAIDGAKARLRPILMTSFAFIFGLMPLVLTKGVGHEGNNAIGTGAVGGMFVGTVFGILVIPSLYVFFQWLQEKITRKTPVIVQTNED